MADYRTIKKGTYDDEKLASFPFACRWLYIGLWIFADDSGVIKASAKFIKPKVFPYDDSLRVSEVEKWLKSLEEARMLIPLSYINESYYIIRTFLNHQKIDKRYAKYVIPPELVKTTLDAAREIPTAEEKRIEENRREENKGGATETEEDGLDELGQSSKKGNPPSSGAPPLELAYPWTSEQFLCQWRIWKEYKLQEFKFKYKSIHSEQAALKSLAELSQGYEETAIAIINQSIAKSWKGFFGLDKQIKHEQGTTKTGLNATYKQFVESKVQRNSGNGIHDPNGDS